MKNFQHGPHRVPYDSNIEALLNENSMAQMKGDMVLPEHKDQAAAALLLPKTTEIRRLPSYRGILAYIRDHAEIGERLHHKYKYAGTISINNIIKAMNLEPKK